jgi:hypothetical protein
MLGYAMLSLIGGRAVARITIFDSNHLQFRSLAFPFRFI